MKNKRVLLLISILAVVIACTTIFFGCKKSASLEIKIEGDAYRGAILPVSAEFIGSEEAETAEFYVKEDISWVFFSDGNLVFAQNAEVGKTITVCVKIGDTVAEKQITVGHTPVTSVELKTVETVEAGDEIYMSAALTPRYADDVYVEYKIVEGVDLATIVEDALIVSEEANHTDVLRVVAIAGGVESEPVTIKIKTIQPETIEIISSATTLKRGESAQISVKVTPKNCTLGDAQLSIEESDYYIFAGGKLTISNSAPVSEVALNATLGKLKTALTINIEKTPVDVVNVSADHNTLVRKNDVVTLRVDVLPINANDRDATITVVEGEDLIEFNDEKTAFKVISGEVNKEIVIVAEADGVRHAISFLTEAIPVQWITVTADGDPSVNPGSERSYSVSYYPTDAYVANKTAYISKGENYAEIKDDKVIFKDVDEFFTDPIEVCLTVDYDGKTDEISFYVVMISVESVEISALSSTVDLNGGDRISFSATITPSNASCKTVEYHFSEEGSYGVFEGNTLTIAQKPPKGSVYVYAMTADGKKSNYVLLDISGELENITPASWGEIDGKKSVFNDINNVRLNLSALPRDAEGTTIILPDNVEYIEIVGGYEKESDIIENLFFYFLNNKKISVKLYSLGIEITCGLNGNVLDFGNSSTVFLDFEGENLIVAGSPYKAYTYGYTVDGKISGDKNDYILKHGMDGFGGLNGGNGINAKRLEIRGSGKLIVKGGDGADGTDGGNGASGGNGGNGGYGGDAGYAVFTDSLYVYPSGEILLKSGNAGKGGKGGTGVVAGNNGDDGVVVQAVFANSALVNEGEDHIEFALGEVRSSSRIRETTLAAHVSLLERYYKIDLHYGNDLYNPYSRYDMKPQTFESDVKSMLYALEYAMAIFPKNLFVELQSVNKLNIYFVSSIQKKSSTSPTYGLTSSGNNMWLATFDTRLRGIFYSTHYNIFIHELFHVLTFNMSEQLEDNPMYKGLPGYNLNYGYTTSSSGVYDPNGSGYSANNSAFLTAYSKSNFNEDISDNMSLICMLVTSAAFMNDNMPINKKCAYISSEYENFYENLTSYTKVVWKRYL